MTDAPRSSRAAPAGPALHIQPDVLYFGECPVSERRDIVVSLHNAHRLSALDWSIPRVPHMHVARRGSARKQPEPGQGRCARWKHCRN